jgi:site-specific DNA recombinase
MIGKAATTPETRTRTRCAVYTRKSHAEGLDQDFNSLDAQREACLAYITSHRQEGWEALPDRFDDGGFSGGTLDRPALRRLLKEVETGRVQCIVVYKIDRLSRSMFDFVRLVEVLDRHEVAFVSVTQSFDTSTSMGRLLVNVLLSFAQFEREQTGDRIRDKVAAAKKKGKYCGGLPTLGYDVKDMRLVVNEAEAPLVRQIFRRFIKMRSTTKLARELNTEGHVTKSWTTRKGKYIPGKPWNKHHLYRVLNDRKYIGEITHLGTPYKGEHEGIVERGLWDRAHAILKENQKSRGNKTRTKTPALLRGVIRCGTHDKAMGVTFSRRRERLYRYYLCGHAAKNGYVTCPTPTVAAGEVEEAVVGQLRRVFRAPEMITRAYSEVRTNELQAAEKLRLEKAGLEKQIGELKAAVTRAMGSGGNGHGTVGERVEELTSEIRRAEARWENVAAELACLETDALRERDVADALTRLDPVWDELFPAEQERIVKLLVQKVTVGTGGLTIRIRADGLGSLVSELLPAGRREDSEP